MTAFPLPDLDFEPIRPFYAAAARDELAIPRCGPCATWNWVPPERCRSCGSDQLVWSATCGRGTLFSWAWVERAWVKEFAGLAPYVTGLVRLSKPRCIRVMGVLPIECESALRAGAAD